jgi:hypothetical protein
MGPENQGDYPHGNGKLNIYAYLDQERVRQQQADGYKSGWRGLQVVHGVLVRRQPH